MAATHNSTTSGALRRFAGPTLAYRLAFAWRAAA